MRNPWNILRHELIGLDCSVASAKNKSMTKIKGRIVDETMNNIIIGEKERKTVPKKGTMFTVKLSGKTVKIDGNFIITRPEDRIKKKIKKW